MELSKSNSSNLEEIKQLFTKTFSDSEGNDEGMLIGNLAHDLIANTDQHNLHTFIATEDDQIIGSIIFSKLTFENDTNAFLLGPVAVSTDHQKMGIGQQLINFGLKALKDIGVELVMTYGDPKFYTKFGFTPVTEEIIKAPLKLTYPEGWLAQSFVSDAIKPIAGNSSCIEAINKPEYW